MSSDEHLHPQDRPTPTDDLTPYRGQWIASRDRHVVASNLDLGDLFKDPAVRNGDAIMHIPADPSMPRA